MSAYDAWIGKQIGNFLLEELLGEGGMGIVFRARHISLRTVVAIKTLRSGMTLEDEMHRQFQEEAGWIARFGQRSVHILPVLDCGYFEGKPFLVTACAASNLNFTYNRVLSLDEMLMYARAIALGLQAIHNEHLVHRDLKPANVLRGFSNEIWLADFGIAVLSNTVKFEQKAIIGTYPYMSPEQWAGEAHQGSDQYALGVMIYRWLCGRFPFTADSAASWAYQHTHARVPNFSDFGVTIHPLIESIVIRMLSKRWEDRFASVLEAVDTLESAIHSVEEQVIHVKASEQQNKAREAQRQFIQSLIDGRKSALDEAVLLRDHLEKLQQSVGIERRDAQARLQEVYEGFESERSAQNTLHQEEINGWIGLLQQVQAGLDEANELLAASEKEGLDWEATVVQLLGDLEELHKKMALAIQRIEMLEREKRELLESNAELEARILEQEDVINTFKCNDVNCGDPHFFAETTHEKEWATYTPGYLILLVDQSQFMLFSRASIANVVNGFLDRILSLNVDGISSVYNRVDVTILGYGDSNIYSLLSHPSGENTDVFTLTELRDSSIRIDLRKVIDTDDTGREYEVEKTFSVWIEDKHVGDAPMCAALMRAKVLAEQWVSTHVDSYPPIVMNITAGVSSDGDPLRVASELRSVCTSDGHVLLYTSMFTEQQTSFSYPLRERDLPDLPVVQNMFRISSPLPDIACSVLNHRVYGIKASLGARGFCLNTNLHLPLQYHDGGPVMYY